MTPPPLASPRRQRSPPSRVSSKKYRPVGFGGVRRIPLAAVQQNRTCCWNWVTITRKPKKFTPKTPALAFVDRVLASVCKTEDGVLEGLSFQWSSVSDLEMRQIGTTILNERAPLDVRVMYVFRDVDTHHPIQEFRAVAISVKRVLGVGGQGAAFLVQVPGGKRLVMKIAPVSRGYRPVPLPSLTTSPLAIVAPASPPRRRVALLTKGNSSNSSNSEDPSSASPSRVFQHSGSGGGGAGSWLGGASSNVRMQSGGDDLAAWRVGVPDDQHEHIRIPAEVHHSLRNLMLYNEVWCASRVAPFVGPAVYWYGHFTMLIPGTPANGGGTSSSFQTAPQTRRFEAIFTDAIHTTVHSLLRVTPREDRMQIDLLTDLMNGFRGALDQMHQNTGLVHHDIKHGNIGFRLVSSATKEGGGGGDSAAPKLEFCILDHGIVQPAGRSFDAYLEQPHVQCPPGTVRLMSPRSHLWMPAHPIDDHITLLFTMLEFAWRPFRPPTTPGQKPDEPDEEGEAKPIVWKGVTKAMRTLTKTPSDVATLRLMIENTMPWERLPSLPHPPSSRKMRERREKDGEVGVHQEYRQIVLDHAQFYACVKFGALRVESVYDIVQYMVYGDRTWFPHFCQSCAQPTTPTTTIPPIVQEVYTAITSSLLQHEPLWKWWLEQARDIRARWEPVPGNEYLHPALSFPECQLFRAWYGGQ